MTARIRPSKLALFRHCNYWVDSGVEDPPGEAALLGTKIHGEISAFLQARSEPVGSAQWSILEYLSRRPIRALHIEQKVFSDLFDGTPDLVIEWANGVLEILDWKTGVPPTPVRNPQLLAYAYATCADRGLSPEHVVLTIAKFHSWDCAVDFMPWACFTEDLETFASEHRELLRRKVQPTPGDHCFKKYCPLRKVCRNDSYL